MKKIMIISLLMGNITSAARVQRADEKRNRKAALKFWNYKRNEFFYHKRNEPFGLNYEMAKTANMIENMRTGIVNMLRQNLNEYSAKKCFSDPVFMENISLVGDIFISVRHDILDQEKKLRNINPDLEPDYAKKKLQEAILDIQKALHEQIIQHQEEEEWEG